MIKKAFHAYFTFTKRERNGLLVLLALTGVCLCIPLLWETCMPGEGNTDSSFLAEVQAFRSEMALADSLRARRPTIKRNFIGHARDTTGSHRRFFKRDTVRRYTARFPRQPPLRRYVPPVIDINTADSAAWEALPGIGPTLAARTIRFREKLGGFCTIAQVGETFGLPDSTFKKIQPSLRLHGISLKKIDINEMDEKSLAQHPYIRYKLARLIVQYRSVHGLFSRSEELQNIPLVNDSIYRKLEPYIIVSRY